MWLASAHLTVFITNIPDGAGSGLPCDVRKTARHDAEQAREMCDTARKQGKVLAYDFTIVLHSIRNSCVNR